MTLADPINRHWSHLHKSLKQLPQIGLRKTDTCGANTEGGGGFQQGNTCAGSKAGEVSAAITSSSNPQDKKKQTGSKPKTNFGGVEKSAPPTVAKAWLKEWSHFNSPEVHKASEEWVKGGGGEHKAGLDSIYADTQAKLKAAGIEQMKLYRGIVLPKSHPLAKAMYDDKHKLGDSVDIAGDVFVSWTTSKKEAEAFAQASLKNGKVGVVFEKVVKAEDIISAHGVHSGFKFPNEKEVVVKQPASSGKYKIVASPSIVMF